MRADDILRSLGLSADDPRVTSVLDAHGLLRWRPALDPERPDRYTDWYPIAGRGIEFGFMDRAYFEAEEPGLRGRLGMVFHEVIFYARHPQIGRYAGDLPFAIDFGDDRATVRRRLHATGVAPRAYRRDVWDLGDRRLIVSYGDDDRCVTDLIVCLPERPWPSDGPRPPHPPITVIASLLGAAVDGAGFRRVFQPLGVGYEVDRLGAESMIDLRAEFGFDIHVGVEIEVPGRPPSSAGRFDSITFYRDRELDARQWQGELPFDLSFSDASPDALAKVPSRPVESAEHGLTGWALWRFEGCWLQIVYSLLDNLVHRVSLFRKELLPLDSQGPR